MSYFKKSEISSRGSARSRSAIFLRNTSSTIRKQILRIIDEEDTELIVYSIREELITKVMDEIQKTYLSKQCVKYLVHCSYLAICQMLSQYFYVHEHQGFPYYAGHPHWAPDLEPEPSAPDSWAAQNVPSYKRSLESLKGETESWIGDYDKTGLTKSEGTMTEDYEPESILEEDACTLYVDSVGVSECSSKALITEQLDDLETFVAVGRYGDYDAHAILSKESEKRLSTLSSSSHATRQTMLPPIPDFGSSKVKPSFETKCPPLPSLPWSSPMTADVSAASSPFSDLSVRVRAKLTPMKSVEEQEDQKNSPASSSKRSKSPR